MNEAQVLHALRMVIDPEVGINIVDLGLIYEVDIQERAVEVQLTMTSPTCPLGHLIISQARDILKRKFKKEVETVDIQLVWEPPWTPEMMSDIAKRQLGWQNKE